MDLAAVGHEIAGLLGIREERHRCLRVDEHEVRPLRRLGGVVKQRLACGVHAIGPAALARPGLEHPLAGARHDDVVGAEEALLLVGEELVEGTPRYSRQGDHVGHGGRAIAPLVDRLDHRAVEAGALVAGHLLAVHAVRSVRQPAVQRCLLGSSSVHPHGSRR